MSKEIERQWFQKLFSCGIFYVDIWVEYCGSPVFQCIIAALLKYTMSYHCRYTCIKLPFKRKHTFNTARDFQRNYVNLGLTDRWIIVVVGLRQSARRVGVSSLVKKSDLFLFSRDKCGAAAVAGFFQVYFYVCTPVYSFLKLYNYDG